MVSTLTMMHLNLPWREELPPCKFCPGVTMQSVRAFPGTCIFSPELDCATTRWPILLYQTEKDVGAHSIVDDHRTSVHIEWRELSYLSFPLAAYEVGSFQTLAWISAHRVFRQACGENLKAYGTRMDTIWSLRSAYSQARRVKLAQDEYCSLVEANLWDSITGPFPEEYQWEMLVDVLRGRVKVLFASPRLQHCLVD